MDPRVAELVVLCQRADRLGPELHKIDSYVGDLVMAAADNLSEAGRVLAEMQGYDESCGGCDNGEHCGVCPCCETAAWDVTAGDGLEDL